MGKSFDAQVAVFLEKFPEGFADPVYVFQERGQAGATTPARGAYKDYASTLANTLFSEEALMAMEAVGGRGFYAAARMVARAARNLLFSIESARLGEQWREVASEAKMAEALRRLLYGTGPLTERFDAYAATFMPQCATSWPILTLIPALVLPKEFFFVKPKYAKAQAKILGHSITKTTPPTGAGYEQYMSMARALEARLRDSFPLAEPHDLLDVYSFSFRSIGTGSGAEALGVSPLCSYRVERTRGLLVLDGGDVLDPGGPSDEPWRRLSPDGRVERLALAGSVGALVESRAAARILQARGASNAPTWWTWPVVERAGEAPDVGVDDMYRRVALLAANRRGDRIAWIAHHEGMQLPSTLRVLDGTEVFVTSWSNARRVAIPPRGSARLVMNRAGTYAALIHAGDAVVVVDLERSESREIAVPASGHPTWGSIHPDLPLVAVFERGVHLVDFSRSEPVVTSSVRSAPRKLGGEFTADGQWLLFCDDKRLYGHRLGTKDVHSLMLPSGGPENEPLRIDPGGETAYVACEDGVLAYRIAELRARLADAPICGKFVRFGATGSPSGAVG